MREKFEKKFHRLVDMLYLLQGTQGHTVASLARHYSVTTRTSQRDLEDLRGARFPVENLGRNRGHRMDPGYRLPQNALSLSEVVPLVVGSQLVDNAAVQTALAKLRAVSLNGVERAVVTNVPERVLHSRPIAGDGWLEPLSAALARGKQVRVVYSSAQRILEPWTLLNQGMHWYLHAFDLQRHDARRFRLDRFTSVEILTQDVSQQRPSADTARFHPWDLGDGKPQHVTLAVEAALEEWLRENPAHPSQTLTPGKATYQVRNQQRFFGWLLSLDGACLVEPSRWRASLTERLRDLLAHYR